MTPDHEIDWTAAGKLAENWARLCYPETPEGNLARAYLDAMAQRDEATELIEKWLLHYNEEYWEPSPDETEKAARAFLTRHRKTGANK